MLHFLSRPDFIKEKLNNNDLKFILHKIHGKRSIFSRLKHLICHQDETGQNNTPELFIFCLEDI